MRILVTGGAGFIGSHVVDAYVAAGHEVVVLDNFSTGRWGNVHPGVVDACEVDICDRQSVREVLKDFKPDVVNHHAALIDVIECEKDPKGAEEINTDGTRIVLEEGIRAGIKEFIFASSGGAIYGECLEPATEKQIPTPCGVYGQSKSSAEASIIVMRNVIPFVILRYANVYGPRGDHGVIPAFEKAVQEGKPLSIYGDGKQVRDFIHVRDVARANVLALEHEGTFNIGTGVSMSINGLARAIGGEAWQRRYLPARDSEIQESRLDVLRAKEVMGFKATSAMRPDC